MNIEKLVALANYLDEIGLSDEADVIDNLISEHKDGKDIVISSGLRFVKEERKEEKE